MTILYDDLDLGEEWMDRDMRRLLDDLDSACTATLSTLPPARRAAIAHLLAEPADGTGRALRRWTGVGNSPGPGDPWSARPTRA